MVSARADLTDTLVMVGVCLPFIAGGSFYLFRARFLRDRVLRSYEGRHDGGFWPMNAPNPCIAKFRLGHIVATPNALARLTPVARTISATLAPPVFILTTSSAFARAVGFRPRYFPAAFAAAMPQRWRSSMRSRSKEAIPPIRVSSSFPVAVAVSMSMLRMRTRTPRLVRSSTILNRSRGDECIAFAGVVERGGKLRAPGINAAHLFREHLDATERRKLGDLGIKTGLLIRGACPGITDHGAGRGCSRHLISHIHLRHSEILRLKNEYNVIETLYPMAARIPQGRGLMRRAGHGRVGFAIVREMRSFAPLRALP